MTTINNGFIANSSGDSILPDNIPMDKTPIIKMLSSYLEKETVSFHMPGHTNGKSFSSWLTKNALAIDTTELQFTDDLHSPTKSIKKALNLAAEAFGSKETFFVTTGSTTAIYAALLSSTKPSDKIILFRNVHKSVLNACIMFNLVPVFTLPQDLDDTLKQNLDAKLVFLTSPDYYGKCEDISSIANIVHSHGLLLIIDEAHGTHFGFCPGILPESAVKLGGDIVIQSAHKTVPALTQGSYLHISHDAVRKGRISYEKVSEALTMITTSSPSFLIAATLDFARAYLVEFGKQASMMLYENIMYFYSLLSPTWLDCFENLTRPSKLSNSSRNYCKKFEFIQYDPFRLVINLDKVNFSTKSVVDILTSKGIFIEFYDLSRIVIICKFENSREDFEHFALVLNEIHMATTQEYSLGSASLIKTKTSCFHYESESKPLISHYEAESNTLISLYESESKSLISLYEKVKSNFPKVKFPPNCALSKKDTSKLVSLSAASGMISIAALVPYPPGIPLIWPGEVIDSDMIELITGFLDYGISVYGVVQQTDPVTQTLVSYIKCIEEFS